MNTRVLFILAVESWTTWLPSFLKQEGVDVDYAIWKEGDIAPPISLLDGYHGVVFLSYHSTLLRDAIFSSEYRTAFSQPITIAKLAHDKRAMCTYATDIKELFTIPELSLREAKSKLILGDEEAVILKGPAGTEGDTYRLITNASSLEKEYNNSHQENLIIQPFIPGLEFSVNLVHSRSISKVYSPVYKGANSLNAVHPCKRQRYFPASKFIDCKESEFMDASIKYASNIGCEGLMEIEFILSENKLYLLEMNPRLSATLRMSIAGSSINAFHLLSQIAISKTKDNCYISTEGYAMELPVTGKLSTKTVQSITQLSPNISLSSRVTICANSKNELHQLGSQVKQYLHENS